ncbi:MAG: hypothetical protein MK188_12125 [Gammaproteobacteria bacterium]|nr:hypothetical protein [Gammaproteobacteria bacterium]
MSDTSPAPSSDAQNTAIDTQPQALNRSSPLHGFRALVLIPKNDVSSAKHQLIIRRYWQGADPQQLTKISLSNRRMSASFIALFPYL